MSQHDEDGVDVTHLLGVADLENDHCRWPIGDPKKKGFHFCGEPREDAGQPIKKSRPYCAAHNDRASNKA